MRNSTPTTWPPDSVPVLSRGKHRRPRSGACFMELVSYVAGEPWSDHPTCTHAALAALARDVNDYTTDEGRHRLAPLIPSVIGLSGDDSQVDVDIALRAATAALPIAAEDRQRVLAVGILRCRQKRADSGRGVDALDIASRRAFESAPAAAEWARAFVRTSAWNRERRGRRRPYLGIVHQAVRGIAEACVPDPDDVLYRLLRDAIEDCQRRLPRSAETSRAPATSTAS